jgi:hypothetical protein
VTAAFEFSDLAEPSIPASPSGGKRFAWRSGPVDVVGRLFCEMKVKKR